MVTVNEDRVENVSAYGAMVSDNVLPALLLSFATLLLLLYVQRMLRAHRAAGECDGAERGCRQRSSLS